jgi:hypothetical protein
MSHPFVIGALVFMALCLGGTVFFLVLAAREQSRLRENLERANENLRKATDNLLRSLGER